MLLGACKGRTICFSGGGALPSEMDREEKKYPTAKPSKKKKGGKGVHPYMYPLNIDWCVPNAGYLN